MPPIERNLPTRPTERNVGARPSPLPPAAAHCVNTKNLDQPLLRRGKQATAMKKPCETPVSQHTSQCAQLFTRNENAAQQLFTPSQNAARQLFAQTNNFSPTPTLPAALHRSVGPARLWGSLAPTSKWLTLAHNVSPAAPRRPRALGGPGRLRVREAGHGGTSAAERRSCRREWGFLDARGARG